MDLKKRRKEIANLKIALHQAYQDNSLGRKSEVLSENDWDIYSQLQVDSDVVESELIVDDDSHVLGSITEAVMAS